jgi:carbon-monoxide dehydrogenase small subunit
MNETKEKIITVTINGKIQHVTIPADRLLVDLLREDLGLTGTKKGCGSGECGACSVILDGRLVDSCLIPAMRVDGSDIVTVEGLAEDEQLNPLQRAFLEKGAVQCGFCTPGMLLAGKNLLDQCPSPTRDEIKAALSGNLCRCTGYVKIVEAIESARKNGDIDKKSER